MNPQTQNKLAAAATVAYTEITNLTEDLTLPQGEYPLAQIIETLDENICPLCQHLHGKIIQRGTPEWEEYRLPSHINCRRAFAYISQEDAADNPPDFVPPPQSLLEKHGHFHTDPRRYEPLRVPAYADRRQFIFVRERDPITGQLRSVLYHQLDVDDIIARILDTRFDDLTSLINLPRPPRTPQPPRSTDELAQYYDQHTQDWATYYTHLDNLIQQLTQISEIPAPYRSDDEFRRVVKSAVARGRIISALPSVYQRERNALLALFQSPNPVRRISVNFAPSVSADMQRAVQQHLQQVRLFVSRGHTIKSVRIDFDASAERGYYLPQQETIYLPKDFLQRESHEQLRFLIHEYYHHLEATNPRLHEKLLALHKAQTQGQQPVSLRQLFGAPYKTDEMAIVDDFPHPYMGKLYIRDGEQYMTELPNVYIDIVFARVDAIALRTRRGQHNEPTGVFPQLVDTLHQFLKNSRTQRIWRTIWDALHNP